jgi:hypothetical protein
MQTAFGSGSLWGIDSGANPTPARFAALQDCGVDFAYNSKELHGEYQLPLTVARGTGKITCKAKFAVLSGRVVNALFFSGTKAAGQTSVAKDEAGTVTTTAITVANSATFVEDLGVRYASTGLALVRVASAPAAGQYTVAAGVYGFNTTDNAAGMKIDYTYTIPSVGEKITLSNQLLGQAPMFKSVFTQSYGGQRHTLTLNANVSSKLGFGSKLEDFVMPEMDFSSFADAANNIGTWSLAEAS